MPGILACVRTTAKMRRPRPPTARPETGWQKQLDSLEHLIIDNGILERDISQIDLRSPTQYFFLLKNGEKKDVERGKET